MDISTSAALDYGQTFTLAAEETAPGHARRAVNRYLKRIGGGARDTCVLLVSELVTNAIIVQDFAGTVGVVLAIRETDVFLGAIDSGPGIPASHDPSAIDEHGRGLVLVDTLADRWGWFPLRGAKCVWASVRL